MKMVSHYKQCINPKFRLNVSKMSFMILVTEYNKNHISIDTTGWTNCRDL